MSLTTTTSLKRYGLAAVFLILSMALLVSPDRSAADEPAEDLNDEAQITGELMERGIDVVKQTLEAHLPLASAARLEAYRIPSTR